MNGRGSSCLVEPLGLARLPLASREIVCRSATAIVSTSVSPHRASIEFINLWLETRPASRRRRHNLCCVCFETIISPPPSLRDENKVKISLPRSARRRPAGSWLAAIFSAPADDEERPSLRKERICVAPARRRTWGGVKVLLVGQQIDMAAHLLAQIMPAAHEHLHHKASRPRARELRRKSGRATRGPVWRQPD